MPLWAKRPESMIKFWTIENRMTLGSIQMKYQAVHEVTI